MLIVDMEKSLEAITKWLTKSGLKVNDEKTELCLLHRKNQPKTRLAVNAIELQSKGSINVLGVEIDSRLQRGALVSNVINKAKSVLHAIRLVRRYLNETYFRGWTKEVGYVQS